jgi:hypothetical protein
MENMFHMQTICIQDHFVDVAKKLATTLLKASAVSLIKGALYE